jgi:hypothetical protein
MEHPTCWWVCDIKYGCAEVPTMALLSIQYMGGGDLAGANPKGKSSSVYRRAGVRPVFEFPPD